MEKLLGDFGTTVRSYYFESKIRGIQNLSWYKTDRQSALDNYCEKREIARQTFLSTQSATSMSVVRRNRFIFDGGPGFSIFPLIKLTLEAMGVCPMRNRRQHNGQMVSRAITASTVLPDSSGQKGVNNAIDFNVCQRYMVKLHYSWRSLLKIF